MQKLAMEPWHDRLRRLRAKTGLSQAKVAAFFGIKPPSVAQWELGRSRPDVDKLPRLARLYGVSLEELCGDDLPLLAAKQADVGAVPIEIDAAQLTMDAAETRETAKIGDRVRWAREANRYDLPSVRAQLRFRDGELEAIEGGRRPPTVFQLLQLSYALHVSADYLLRGYLTARTEQAVGNILLWREQAEPEPGMEVPARTDSDRGKIQPLGKSRRPRAGAEVP